MIISECDFICDTEKSGFVVHPAALPDTVVIIFELRK